MSLRNTEFSSRKVHTKSMKISTRVQKSVYCRAVNDAKFFRMGWEVLSRTAHQDGGGGSKEKTATCHFL